MLNVNGAQTVKARDMIYGKNKKLKGEDGKESETAGRYQENNKTISADGVTLTISQEAKEQRAWELAEWMRQQKDQYQMMAEQEKENGEKYGEALKIQMKCLQIAMHIVSGDKVPPEDESYLLEHDPELYTKAVSMRMPKEDPEECDSVLEEEDREEQENTGAYTIAETSPKVVVE